MPYFRTKASAIIGGVCHSSQDIIDKILLANSFLDTFSKIYFVGEIGIAALNALDIYPGKVERSSKNIEEYDRVKEFFITLYENSLKKKCELVFPVDFLTAKKESLETIEAQYEQTK